MKKKVGTTYCVYVTLIYVTKKKKKQNKEGNHGSEFIYMFCSFFLFLLISLFEYAHQPVFFFLKKTIL